MPASIDQNGDVIIDLTGIKFKVRTEHIVINNRDTDNKTITLDQSMRTMDADGNMGANPLTRLQHTVTPADIVGITIDGITGLQVFTWIQKWATGVNLAEADEVLATVMPVVPETTPTP
jgi:hypothetical protein